MHNYFRDPVTDLFSQEYYLTQLEQAIERSRRRRDYLFSAIVFSLDPEAKNNHHLTSNELNNVLVIIASRLTRYLRPTDTLARLYAETFATLHDDIKQQEDALVIAQRIFEKLSAPYNVRKEPITLSFCLGVVANGREYQNAGDIINQAEQKMQEELRAGGNRIGYVTLT